MSKREKNGVYDIINVSKIKLMMEILCYSKYCPFLYYMTSQKIVCAQ